MKKIVYLSVLIAFSALFNSCNESTNNDDNNNTKLSTDLTKAEGGKYYGGELKLNSIVKYTSLFPASISDVYSQHIASQIFDGLLKYNQKTLEIEYCIAESVDIDASKKIYTFNLRKGIKFHDDDCFENGKGREVNANDFKTMFEFLCSNHELNKSKYLIADFIKGSDDYASGKTKELSGVKVIADNKLQIELNEPFSGFEKVLALGQTAIYPIEAFNKYGDKIGDHPVGTGPFIMSNNADIIELVKNPNYWKKDEFGNQLPYISKIKISFEENKSQELASFNAGDLDFVWGVPVEEIPNIMGSLDEALEGKNREFELQSVNSLQIQYFGFNLNHPAFSNKKVRQAFNYAINKDSIVDYILQGEGDPANYGIVPAMQGYPNETIKGYTYNLPLAKKLLAEAGYPNGKNFPEVKLPYSNAGQVNQLLIKSIQEQLNTNLGLNITIVESKSQDINENRENGKLDFWRYGWIADYPDPSNFIAQFQSKYIVDGEDYSINYSRYKSEEFDALMAKALTETDEDKRMNIYAKAEQVLLNDAVFIPIYYATEIRLINPLLKDFFINEIEFRDYSTIYFTKEKAQKKIRVYDNFDEEVE